MSHRVTVVFAANLCTLFSTKGIDNERGQIMRVFLFALSVVAHLMAPSISFADDSGVYSGVGVGMKQLGTEYNFDSIIAGGPAARANILPGQWLVAINRFSTRQMNLNQVVSYLRGPVGTTVLLTVMTADRRSLRDVNLVRELINEPCFIEGWASLRYYGTPSYATITGTIGNDTFGLVTSYGSAGGGFKGEQIQLSFSGDSGNFMLSGMIHGVYVNWYGYNGNMSFYQSCIP